MKYSAEQIEEFEKYRNNLLEKIARSISTYTVQFFYDTEKGVPKATGSGILFEIQGRHFLITAAHVIAEHPDNTYLVIGKDGVNPAGRLYSVTLPISQSRDDDKIDVAIIELDEPIANLIKTQHDFLTLNDVEFGHVKNQKFQYLSYGFPATKAKLKKSHQEDIIEARPFIYNSTIHPNFDYKRFGFREDAHIPISFTGEVLSYANKTPHKAPDLRGISGSGLWHLNNFPFPEAVRNRKLIGITIERVNKLDNKVIIATAFDIVSEFMRTHLGLSAIPKSPTINLLSTIT